jgi:hypothetical protein
VGPKTGLDRCGKSRPPSGIRSPYGPARSQLPYRLSYPTHYLWLFALTKELDLQLPELRGSVLDIFTRICRYIAVPFKI